MPADLTEQSLEKPQGETLRSRAKRLAVTTEAGKLIDEILEKHHTFLEANLSPTLKSIKKLAETTRDASADKALAGAEAMAHLQLEIALHLMLEEMCLFPHILDMLDADSAFDSKAFAERLCEGPIRQLEEDHSKIKSLLAQVSLVLIDSDVKIASDIEAWNEARDRFQKLVADIDKHTHLEDERLFPLIRSHIEG